MSPKNENKRLSKNSKSKAQLTPSTANHLTFACPKYTAEQISRLPLVTCLVSKEAILLRDCSEMARQLDEFRRAGCTSFAKLQLLIDGYARDDRKAFQIPEIRAYIKQLYALYPELFLYMLPNLRNYYLFCLLDVDYEISATNPVRRTQANIRQLIDVIAVCSQYNQIVCEYYCCLPEELDCEQQSETPLGLQLEKDS